MQHVSAIVAKEQEEKRYETILAEQFYIFAIELRKLTNGLF
jgi:hypothetical protein